MKKTIKTKIVGRFPKITACYLLIFNKKSYLYQTGWLHSQKTTQALDKEGEQIPWMNYSIVSFLKDRLNKTLKVFEYGSGFSTSFYAKHAHSVRSIEYDPIWWKFIKKIEHENDNVEIVYQDKDVNGEYCRAIKKSKVTYDVVIVDGRDRVNCIKQSIESISDSGVILLDDSDRDRYQEGILHAKSKGFRVLDFQGLKPGGLEMYVTSLLYRDNNCFKL
jgi:hypothetical protein